MENINTIIGFLSAFKEGKTVQYQTVYVNGTSKWENIKDIKDLIGCLYRSFNLRIAKEPKYRPYKNAEEFMEAIKEHGPFIKNADQYHNILMVDGVYGIVTHDGTARHVRCYEELLHLYTWQDGHLCGILEE